MNDSQHDIRIGQILVEQGVLTEQQVFEIVEAQRQRGVPFGVLAEKMFDVTVESIEEAWIEQYCRLTGEFDLTERDVDRNTLHLINRRQAWQFEILPLRVESDGELLMAASRHRLARAVTFAANRIEHNVYFRIANRDQLQNFLREHYPMSEVSEEILKRAREMANDDRMSA